MSIRRVVLVVAALLALPTLALAQTSRVEGMAIPGDYIKDYTGIYTYTSCITGVGNLVYGELGNASTAVPSTNGAHPGDRAMGAVLQNLFDGKFGTWAIHLREETPGLGTGDDVSGTSIGNGSDPNFNQNESFDLMWGRKYGTTSLGLRLNRSHYESKVEPLAPGVETKLSFDPTAVGGQNFGRNITGFGGGMSFEMSANTRSDVSFLYQNRSYENSVGTTKAESDGKGTYLLSGRAFYQWQPNVVLVPVFKYYSFDLSQKTSVGPTSFDNSLKGWQAGVAGNWTVGNNDLFVLGVAFASNKVEEKQALFNITDPNTGLTMTDGKATESIAPLVFGALETHVNNWLTLRFGATKGAYRTVKVEPTAGGNSKTTSSPFSMQIGAGVKLATLQLDAVLDQYFPQTLGYIGSGSTRTNFPKVTATYAF